MPRLPTPTATRAPGRSFVAKPLCSSWRRVSPRTSGSRKSGNFWQTMSMRDGSIQQSIAETPSGWGRVMPLRELHQRRSPSRQIRHALSKVCKARIGRLPLHIAVVNLLNHDRDFEEREYLEELQMREVSAGPRGV